MIEDEASSLVCPKIRDLPKGVGASPENTDVARLFLVAFRELAKVYATRDLVEEFCGARIFPVRAGWAINSWSDFAAAIKLSDFAKSFGLCLQGLCCFDMFLLVFYLVFSYWATSVDFA